MRRFVPRSLTREERRIVVDALLRASAESRAIMAKMASAPSLSPDAIGKHCKAMEDLALDQARLAANLDDSTLDIKLAPAPYPLAPHERTRGG